MKKKDAFEFYHRMELPPVRLSKATVKRLKEAGVELINAKEYEKRTNKNTN